MSGISGEGLLTLPPYFSFLLEECQDQSHLVGSLQAATTARLGMVAFFFMSPPSTELAPASNPTAEGTTHFAVRITEALKENQLAWLSWTLGCPFLTTGNGPALCSSTTPLKGLC